MKVGIKTISELSGFSIATVSNVLNNKGSISRDTKEKVLQIAHEVGYICLLYTSTVLSPILPPLYLLSVASN